jgi:hypothetical protein
VSAHDEGVDLDAVLRKVQPKPAPATDGESVLDALLQQSHQTPEPATAKPTTDPLSRTRRLFQEVLLPVADELRAKYEPSGVTLRVDATQLLGNGRGVTIAIEFQAAGMRLDGTVTDSVVAFQQTRYTRSDRSGLTGSGPALSLRNLDGEVFRDFLCQRIATLVRSAMPRKPSGATG